MMKKKVLEALRDVYKVQSWDGNWNYGPYMQGMFNGMELMMSIIENRNPEFREAPNQWLKDIHAEFEPQVACEN